MSIELTNSPLIPQPSSIETEASEKHRMPPYIRQQLVKCQGGKHYLPAAFRIVWFRDERPGWGVETMLIEGGHEAGFATVQAKIFNEEGRVIASGIKTETRQDFPAGWTEKAETQAIARALAIAGYGTQFAPELDIDASHLADSPQSVYGSAPIPKGQPPAEQSPPLDGPSAKGKKNNSPTACPVCTAKPGQMHLNNDCRNFEPVSQMQPQPAPAVEVPPSPVLGRGAGGEGLQPAAPDTRHPEPAQSPREYMRDHDAHVEINLDKRKAEVLPQAWKLLAQACPPGATERQMVRKAADILGYFIGELREVRLIDLQQLVDKLATGQHAYQADVAPDNTADVFPDPPFVEEPSRQADDLPASVAAVAALEEPPRFVPATDLKAGRTLFLDQVAELVGIQRQKLVPANTKAALKRFYPSLMNGLVTDFSLAEYNAAAEAIYDGLRAQERSALIPVAPSGSGRNGNGKNGTDRTLAAISR